MGHNYPYGVWDKYEGWDQRMPYLPPNPIAQPISAVVPYTASVFGHYIRRYKTVDTLLRAANTSSRLLYIKNSDRSYQVDWSCPALRVISLPLPTKLIPAGFRTNASISDNNSTYTNIGSTTCGDNGVATSHIFEYSGASSFTFTTPGAKGGTEQMIHGTNYESDFHFHTVPSANQLPPDHDAMMFHVLLSAIKSFPCDKVSLKTPDDSAFTIGKQLPASVGRPELELPGIGLGGTGSCAGGGAALGGDSGT